MSEFNYKDFLKKGTLIEDKMRPKDLEFEKAKEAERLENHPEKDKIKDIKAMMDREREDQSKSSSLIGRMGDRSLKEDTDILESQFDDLYQVVRNIHHVGEFEDIKEAAEEALQRIGEEFGVNFEYGRD
jgi:hypothetical protein|tara:strand:- start:1450 stop:1836 length:387 start_codon:yes stop_codon:yes gene_type:complete